MDVSSIAGNVPDEEKIRINDAVVAKHPKGSFMDWIVERLRLVRVEIIHDENAPTKAIYRVTHELEACDGACQDTMTSCLHYFIDADFISEMDNGGGTVHGGCIAHLGSM